MAVTSGVAPARTKRAASEGRETASATPIQQICPYLIDDAGAWRRAMASRGHRCDAVVPRARVPVTRQRRLCLTAAHERCGAFAEATAAAIAVGRVETADPGGEGVTRWALSRTAPVVLDHGIVALVSTVGRRRPSGRVASVPGLGRRQPGRLVVAMARLARRRPRGRIILGGLLGVALIGAVTSGLPSALAGPFLAGVLPAPSPEASAEAVLAVRPSPTSAVLVALPSASAPAPTAEPLPTAPPAAASPEVPVPQSYTVASGDTLYALAVRFHTTIRAIQDANGLGDSTLLQIGQVLTIP